MITLANPPPHRIQNREREKLGATKSFDALLPRTVMLASLAILFLATTLVRGC